MVVHMNTTTPAKLTAEEVGEHYRVGARTANDWARSGAIRASKIGRRWLFDAADVDAFFAARSNAPKAATTARRKRRR